MTMLLTLIYFFHARVQERDQLYCECLMKQYHSIAQGHSKKKPGAGAGAADGIQKFVARGGNAEIKESYIQNGIFMLQF